MRGHHCICLAPASQYFYLCLLTFTRASTVSCASAVSWDEGVCVCVCVHEGHSATVWSEHLPETPETFDIKLFGTAGEILQYIFSGPLPRM